MNELCNGNNGKLLRRRVEKDFAWTVGTWAETNETRFIYDGNLVVQERNTNNQPMVEYTRGNDLSGTFQGAGGIGGLLARSQDSLPPTPFYEASSYYHADGNGNITAMINASQTLVAKYLYDSFGNTLAQSGSLADVNAYRFSSKEWNGNSGLYYYLYRFYDPNLQRWVNRDPIGELGGVNLFDFVKNRSINSIDSFGLDENSPPVSVLGPNSGPTLGLPIGTQNCLAYGVCMPGYLNPDGGNGSKNGTSCALLKLQLKSNYGAVDAGPGGSCPLGSHQISISSDGNGG